MRLDWTRACSCNYSTLSHTHSHTHTYSNTLASHMFAPMCLCVILCFNHRSCMTRARKTLAATLLRLLRATGDHRKIAPISIVFIAAVINRYYIANSINTRHVAAPPILGPNTHARTRAPGARLANKSNRLAGHRIQRIGMCTPNMWLRRHFMNFGARAAHLCICHKQWRSLVHACARYRPEKIRTYGITCAYRTLALCTHTSRICDRNYTHEYIRGAFNIFDSVICMRLKIASGSNERS